MKKDQKHDPAAPAHHCGLQGCKKEVALTAEHHILGTVGPHSMCFCLEHAPDMAQVMPQLIQQMLDGSLEEIRIRSTAKLAKDVEAGPICEQTDEELDHARKAGIAAYLRLIGPEGELAGILEHHSDNAVMEAFATLIGALFRHGYLGMENRAFDPDGWTRIMAIGLIRALAHGQCTPKERVGVARVFPETAERLMKYKFTERKSP